VSYEQSAAYYPGEAIKVERPPGPITAAVKEASAALRGAEEAFEELRRRLGLVLDQRERPEAPGAPIDQLPASCELGLELQELGRRLRRLRSEIAETTGRVEL